MRTEYKIKLNEGRKMSEMSKVHELVPRFDIIIVIELLCISTGAWINAYLKSQKGSHVRWFWLSVSLMILFVINKYRDGLKSASRGSAEAFFDRCLKMKSEQLHVNHSLAGWLDIAVHITLTISHFDCSMSNCV